MPASQAFLIVGLSAVSEPASIRIASGLARMMLFKRIELRLNRILDVLDLEVDAAGERRLGHRQLGDADHLLPPVVADEIVRKIDCVFLLLRRGRIRASESAGQQAEHKQSFPECSERSVLPVGHRL